METNIRLPYDFYENLYNEIMDYGVFPENDEDTTCYMGIEIGKFTINLTATFDVNVVDDSFSHAFGTESCYSLEAGDLTDIEIEGIWYYDKENDVEAVLTDQFDEKRFWDQFKRYGAKVNGIDIRHGDEVVVKTDVWTGAWEKMVYLYTDTRTGAHVCTRSIHAKCIFKRFFNLMLPATTGALAIVGKKDYNLRRNA